MRPVRLELEGFASFRERTVVDFDDAELFAFTGPTGAGKSSLIDAITFALYGSVPRYGNRNLVEPVISKGLNEAKVRLDFAVNGERYTAVRVVRRNASGGASTREARLETADGVSLVRNADELSQRVQALLGLPFEHFTKCVVLPQGEFARFLHDGHRDRMDVLEKLLDADIYERIGQQANQRAAAARGAADECRRRLETELAGATPDALVAATDAIAAIDALLATIEDEAPELERLSVLQHDAAARSAAASKAVALLGAIRTPDGAADLAEALARTEALEAEAAALVAETQRDADTAMEALQELPARATLEGALRDHRDSAKLAGQLATARAELAEATAREARAASASDEAHNAHEAAKLYRESVMRDNWAFRAAEKLQAGDRCPICGEVLTAAPALDPPPGHEAATQARDEAARRVETAEAALKHAQGRRMKSDADVASIEARAAEFEARLARQPPVAEIEDLLGKVAAAETVADGARKRQRAAAAAHQQARATLAGLQADREEAWNRFQRARDSVAALDVPEIARNDLGAAWASLAGWARAQLPVHTAAAEVAEAEARDAVAAASAIVAGQHERCAAAGIDTARAAPAAACREALAAHRFRIERLEEQIALAKQLRKDLAERESEQRVASALGEHLSARRTGFRAWYVNHAFRRVVWRASDILESLSRAQYGLEYEDGNFNVVDKANAEERRSVRTLSGGETFLASLALALALSDNLADMAANGAARLDAIFLDEGFGTLDPDTLDVVATALEELGSRGRMVGVVTHVNALAERVPVRFEVSKATGGSRVTRVLV